VNIVVFVKQVPDNTKLKPETVGNQIPRQGVDMMMNPFDEYALETALKLKDAAGGTVTVVSIGNPNCKDIVKKAIAAGADDGVILTEDALVNGDSTVIAKALAKTVQTCVPDHQVLVFGTASLDDATGETAPMVAELLGYPSLTASKAAELTGNTLKVTRETEQGIETQEMTLPAVLGMMKCDYELRSSNIKGVMKANKAEIPVKTLADIGLTDSETGDAGSKVTYIGIAKRPEKQAGQKVDGTNVDQAVAELMTYLKAQKVV